MRGCIAGSARMEKKGCDNQKTKKTKGAKSNRIANSHLCLFSLLPSFSVFCSTKFCYGSYDCYTRSHIYHNKVLTCAMSMLAWLPHRCLFRALTHLAWILEPTEDVGMSDLGLPISIPGLPISIPGLRWVAARLLRYFKCTQQFACGRGFPLESHVGLENEFFWHGALDVRNAFAVGRCVCRWGGAFAGAKERLPGRRCVCRGAGAFAGRAVRLPVGVRLPVRLS